jgi:hypothetical protein
MAASTHDIRSGPWPQIAIVCASLALAVASLALPYTLSGDEWTWLIWGREVLHLTLDTTGGPAWKPLPVLFTPVISLAGDAAPSMWLVLIRASWIVGLVLAYTLGSRLAGRVAGLVAAFGLLLIPNPQPEWPVYLANGAYYPLLLVLLLGAVHRHLDRHRLQALALGCLGALARPEMWLLVVAYGFFAVRKERGRWPVVAALLAAVPLLWLGGGWFGTGDLLGSPQRAQAVNPQLESASVGDLVAAALTKAGQIVIVPFWFLALIAVVLAIGHVRANGTSADRVVLGLGAGALLWLAQEMITAALGLPAWARYMFAPAVMLTVIAGVGFAEGVRAISEPKTKAVAAGLVAVVVAVFAFPRLVAIPSHLGGRGATTRQDLTTALKRAATKERLSRCGGRVTFVGGPHARAAEAAWRLGLPRHAVQTVRAPENVGDQSGVVVVRTRRKAMTSSATPAARPLGALEYRQPRGGGAGPVFSKPADWNLLTKIGKWSVYEARCGPPGLHR